MKKLKYLFIFVLFTLLFKTNNVNAFGIWTANTTVYSGSPVTVSIDMKGLTGRCSCTSSNQGVLAGGDDFFYDDQNGATSFTALNPGQAIITLYCYNPSDQDGTDLGDMSRTITINVIDRPTYDDPIDVNRTYSANNYLSALGIDGYEIKFDKETLEYNIEVDNKVSNINLTATAEDNTASIAGVGEMELVEGKNTFNVTVTAENGNQRVYVVNVLVKELNPTPVKIDKKTYYLVKKEDKLPELDNYVKTSVKIGDEEIPALKGKITKYTLVGLRDDKGDIALYIYNAKDKSYTLYNEVKFNNISLYFMENNKNSYKKTTIKINGKEVIAYKKSGLDYYLIYGMNLNTGKVNWYTYDKEEGTIQKYADGNKANTIDDNKYNLLVYTLASISGLLTFFMMILFIKYKKKMN